MKKLDTLWKYQQADLALERLESRIKATPARLRLNKLHAYLTEQQNSVGTIQKNIETRKTSVDKLAEQVNALEHKYELEVSEFNVMQHDDEVTAEEMTESRKAIESLMTRMDSARRELFDTLAWIERATNDYKDTYAKAGKAKKEYDDTRVQCEEELATAQPEIEEAKRALVQAAAKVDPGLMERYKKIKNHHAVPVAKVENNQCGGCNMALSTTTVKRVAADESIVECENCGRILYSD
jgi:predicted  nucleic acid-binding Zn-ribbon protein